MKTTLATLLVFFSLIQLTFGQTVYYTVIANNGLNLRSDSNLTSSVLLTIPFLSQVEKLEKEIIPNSDLSTQTKIEGKWVKVKFKNKVGYVFDLYLIGHSDNQLSEEEERQNNDFGVTFVGSNCIYNIHVNPRIVWKGVYKINNQFFIKDAKVSYFKSPGIYGGHDLGITTVNNDSLVFLIGSENNVFQNGKIYGNMVDWRNHKPIIKKWGDSIITSNYGFIEIKKINRESLKVMLTVENQTQIIDCDNSSHYPSSLRWRGDLDGDGKDDYIIQFGEKSSSTILFLSSQADQNQIAKPVAFYLSGYCC